MRIRFLLSQAWRRPFVGGASRFSRAWAVAAIVATAVVLPLVGSSQLATDTSFSVHALSSVIRVELPCGGRLSWDLPEGDWLLDAYSDDLQTTGPATAVLLGRSSADVRIDSAGHLQISWSNSDLFRCEAQADSDASADPARPTPEPSRVRRHSQEGTIEMGSGDARWMYRSSQPVQASSETLLLLHGRIRLGELLAAGSGSGGTGLPPMLEAGNIEARTPDSATGQRRLIHSEQLDIGSEVDSHACLEMTGTQSGSGTWSVADCVRASRSQAQGFVRAIHREGRHLLEAQVAVVGSEIGIRSFGGALRKLSITKWSRWVTATGFQMFVACVLALATVLPLLNWVLFAASARNPQEEIDE